MPMSCTLPLLQMEKSTEVAVISTCSFVTILWRVGSHDWDLHLLDAHRMLLMEWNAWMEMDISWRKWLQEDQSVWFAHFAKTNVTCIEGKHNGNARHVCPKSHFVTFLVLRYTTLLSITRNTGNLTTLKKTEFYKKGRWVLGTSPCISWHWDIFWHS